MVEPFLPVLCTRVFFILLEMLLYLLCWFTLCITFGVILSRHSQVIKDLLEKDPTLKNRTVLPVKDIIVLLGFCLKNMNFLFQDQFYEHVEGAAMGSPVRPIVANL